jgi:hypothetical protein
MEVLLNRTPSLIAGAAKSPLPKLAPDERAIALQYLQISPSESDPVVCLRLALAAKEPLLPVWTAANVVDMALSTSDISRRMVDLTARRVQISADSVIEVLERRSRSTPLPVFRILHSVSVPKVKAKSRTIRQSWDEDSAARVMNVLVGLTPKLLKGKKSKVAAAVPLQILQVAEATVLGHPSVELAILGIRLVVVLEREADWSELETQPARRIIEMLSERPAILAAGSLSQGNVLEVSKLSEIVKNRRDAESKFRSAVSTVSNAGDKLIPLATRIWAATYLSQLGDSSELAPSPNVASGAAFERLALILMNSWDAREDGPRSLSSFSVVEEVLKTGFDLHLVGNHGSEISFDSQLHEGHVAMRTGALVRLIRPGVELRSATDIQILIKGIVEPVTADGSF